MADASDILKLLILVDDLDAVLVAVGARFLTDGSEMAVHNERP